VRKSAALKSVYFLYKQYTSDKKQIIISSAVARTLKHITTDPEHLQNI